MSGPAAIRPVVHRAMHVAQYARAGLRNRRSAIPRSTARPSTPNFNACWISSGKQCHDFDAHESCQKSSGQSTTRLRASLSMLRRCARVTGTQSLALTLDHHHRVARCVDEMIDHSQHRTFQILHLETDQVIAIVLAPLRRRQRSRVRRESSARSTGSRASRSSTPSSRAIQPLPCGRASNNFASRVAPFADCNCQLRPLEQSLRRVGERLHPQPAAHAVRRSQSADFNVARFHHASSADQLIRG